MLAKHKDLCWGGEFGVAPTSSDGDSDAPLQRPEVPSSATTPPPHPHASALECYIITYDIVFALRIVDHLAT